MAVATPPSPDHAPMARPRSRGSNDACRMARLPGVSIAAATPWTTRAAISVPTVGAMAQPSEASVNPPAPSMNTRRRPKRSPSAPPSRISPASVSV